MAKDKDGKPALEDAGRPIGADERVEVSEVDPKETDIFDEVLRGQKKQSVERARLAIEKNEAEIGGSEGEEEPDADDEGEEDNEDDEDEEEDNVKAGKAGEGKGNEGSDEDGDDSEEVGDGYESEEEGKGENGSEEGEGIGKAKASGIGKKVAKGMASDKKGLEEDAAEEVEENGDKGEISDADEIGDVDEEIVVQGNDEGFNDWDDSTFDRDVDAHEPAEVTAGVVPQREEIRRTIMQKATDADESLGQYDSKAEKLEFISDAAKKSIFIGRKASIFKNYGFEAGLHIGRVQEKEFEGNEVYLDSLNPHVVFVCGARGSGKSYVIGVIAEELADKNKKVGVVVVDPIGVFWSMRFPNRDEKEKEKLLSWGLEPKGLGNIKVFIPEGVKGQVPKSTYDAGFAMQPSLLTGEDWALTFGVDRFSVSGLLLDKVLKKVEKGYRQIDEDKTGKIKDKKVQGKGANYSLGDLIKCLETDSELNSREKGYKPDSIRAIISRFEAAKTWGIFSEKGTPLRELSKEGQLTILDTSFLEDNVTALVIGILARRLLAARKISTRKEASSKFNAQTMDELLEIEVPPTWLFIDEAHTLIPSGNEVTAATAGLIEYVKQGRRPGLSLVFATQQPSAINTKVLSQLDVIMTHKLIFDDDIKAVFKRTPTIIPRKYRGPNFIKTLPVGVALTGDRREETSRAFVMEIRPRKSQHEGRDAETTGSPETLEQEQVEKLAREMLLNRVKENGFVEMDMARLAIETLNAKYGAKINPESAIQSIAGSGVVVTKEGILLEGSKAGQKQAAKISAAKEDKGLEGPGNAEAEEPDDNIDNEDLQEEAEENKGAAVEQLGLGKKAGEITGQGGIASTELQALPTRIGEESARRIVDANREKKVLGIFGKSESIESLRLKYATIWRVKFDAMTPRKEFISGECFVNSVTGELMHFKGGGFLESKGLRTISSLGEEEATVLKMLGKKEAISEEIMAHAGIDEARAHRIIKSLLDRKLVEKRLDQKTGKARYYAREKLDLPPSERHSLVSSIASLPFVKAEALNVEKEIVSKDDAADSIRKLWSGVVIKRIEAIYKPVWHAVLVSDGKARNVVIDAVNGKVI